MGKRSRSSQANSNFYSRLESLWATLRSRGIVTSGGWRGDETGMSETEMANLTIGRRGDILYRNFMEHDAVVTPFFVVFTIWDRSMVQIEVYPEHISQPELAPIIESFLQAHGA